MWFILTLFSLIHAKTKVFIILHSHNDAGWLETAEEYYQNETQHILSNMLTLLEEDPSLKFSWAEIYYLSEYLESNPSQKPIVKKFIDSNRLEIIGGGWVQNDEALPDYELTLRQMETGFQYLRKELNVTQIKTGWQIDPFGHSSLTAALWEKMGFETLVFARAELNIRNYLELTGNSEFIWKGEGFGTKTGVLTHLLNGDYYPPLLLDWNPLNDYCCFQTLPATDANIEDCVSKFEIYVNSTQYKYKTDNQMMLIGGDFFYSNYTYTKMFLDMISRIIENSSNLDIRYATPSEYFEAVFESGEEFQVFQGDMFPLIDNPNPYINNKGSIYNKVWTGYFSTKPTLKKAINDLQSLVRATEIIEAVVMNSPFIAYNLALSTHHDAITGTCKPWVYTDYMDRLSEDQQITLNALSESYTKALPVSKSSTSLTLPYKVMYLFNPLDWQVIKTLHFDSSFKFVKVFDNTGAVLPVQCVPWNSGFRFFFKYSLDAYTLVVVFISELSSDCEGCSVVSKSTTDSYISNGILNLTLSNGLLHTVSNQNGEYVLDTQIMNYTTRQSGAYTFCPYQAATPSGILENYVVYYGPIVQVAVSEFLAVNETFTQNLILESGSAEFRINFVLRPPPNSDVYLRFSKNYANKAWFYTFNTANVMRKYFKYDSSTRKGNNYYPINGAIFVDLDTDFLYVIPGFPVSGGMVTDKSFEMNLHRYTMWDDGLGLGNVTEQSYEVEHDWLIGFNSPDYSFIWKKYLEHKNQPIGLFRSDNGNSLSLSIDSADVLNGPWNTETSVQLIKENQCSHLVSLAQRENSYLATVMNVCDMPSEFPFRSVETVNLGGLDIDEGKKVWPAGGTLGFWVYNNTGDNVLKYPIVEEEGMIGAFELVAFRTNLEVEDGVKEGLGAFGIGNVGFFVAGVVLIVVGKIGIDALAIGRRKNPIYKV